MNKIIASIIGGVFLVVVALITQNSKDSPADYNNKSKIEINNSKDVNVTVEQGNKSITNIDESVNINSNITTYVKTATNVTME